MKIITLEQLKSILMIKNGSDYDPEREIVVTEIKNRYEHSEHIIFSVNGSPCRGQAILYKTSVYTNVWRGMLYYLDTRYEKMTLRKMYDVVEIIKPYKQDEVKGNV